MTRWGILGRCIHRNADRIPGGSASSDGEPNGSESSDTAQLRLQTAAGSVHLLAARRVISARLRSCFPLGRR